MNKTFILSDESINSYGFKVLTSGIALEKFRANPVMLYDHDPNKVIGKWLNIRVEDSKLMAEAEFDLEDPFAKEIARKVDKGYLKGASMGFMPEDVIADDVISSEIFEASICSLPSNGGALALYNKDGVKLSRTEAEQYLSFQQNKNPNDMNKITLSARALLLLTLSATATEVEADAAIEKLAEENKTLKAQLKDKEDKEKADQEKAAIELVETALSAKKFPDTQKEHYLAFAKTNYAGCKSVLEAIAPAKNIIETLSKKAPATGATPAVDANDKSTWTYDDWSKKDSKGLLAMKASDNATYLSLLEAKKTLSRSTMSIAK